ncbi:hypothetical protein CPC16_010899 [Podila verticillata]|nr:hypothetical protein BGZ52_001284 [Haplosporangium bisporale]KAF9211626.1 hypothetical protein BGZ59_007808 [Podila verticillata]KAF9379160.1 hypothetical protein CPC16_010899 [Podila verticillata]KAI9242848.1 MAG: hypothetical protein BYD32DRAFT_401959 [Podila humilis]KFH69450.1 hypothetical protein MVEG_04262 [Podila verticillata NRRL 6337]
MTKLISLTLILSISALCSLPADAQSTPGACVLTVPKDPLSAKGLATPYILKKGNCDQTNPDQQVFVEATVFDPATGIFGVYQPLVINEGTEPAIAPVVPTIPKGAIIGLWFGANANSVTLEGDLRHSDCVNGLSHTDIFGQVAFCNANNFFKAVDTASKVVIPPLGNDIHGQPCPTTRHFGIIDQDQSDNVITTYLQQGNRFAQATKKNREHLKKFVEFSNGSDNALVAELIDPAIKCTPFKAPSLMEPNVLLGSMALNELHASRQAAPVALVPASDPMVLSNGKPSLRKLNAYRRGVNQPLVHSLRQASTKVYCQNFNKIAPRYIEGIAKQLVGRPSPDAAAANNLLTFMGQRYAASWTNLGCDKLLKITSDITVTVNKQGVATEVHFHQSKPIKMKKD